MLDSFARQIVASHTKIIRHFVFILTAPLAIRARWRQHY